MEASLQAGLSEEENLPYMQLRELAIGEINSPEEERYLDQEALLRFLRAREYHVSDAFEMWKKWKAWRISYRIDFITDESVQRSYVTGKALVFGHDRHNHPCIIVRVRFHEPDEFSVEETMHFAIWLMEKAVKQADELGSKKICVIHDRGSMTARNKDTRLMELGKSMSGMLQDFYAERLASFYVLHVNWLYWLMYQVMKPLMNRKTRDKIHILKNPRDLLEFFDEDQLLPEYGGSSTYHHPYPAS